MQLLMMGTGPFAVPTFRALLAAPEHAVQALVTRPVPAPRGRRREEAAPNPMREVGQQVGLPIFAPESVNATETLALLAEFQADLLVVCDYGQILSAAALATARLGGINLHASLLPRYRGAAPINWALYHGETETGVSVIHMTPRLDAGPCVVQSATPIEPAEDAVALERRLALLGANAVIAALDRIAHPQAGVSEGVPQDSPTCDAGAATAEVRRRRGLESLSPRTVQSGAGVQAVAGHVHGVAAPKGPLRLLLEQVHVVQAPSSVAAPGTVVESAPGTLAVACETGILGLDVIQPAGKKPLTADVFLRGYPVRPGDHF